jgi:hypothetical protein
MLTRSLRRHLEQAADERGAVLIVTAIVLLTLTVAAAYAIDTSYWFVHHRHLQTEADAAALAGGQAFQFPCDSTLIANAVHQYDGTTASTSGYNGQVPIVPNVSTSHNLFSLINQQNFYQQSKPSDSLKGDPCTDSAVDVKMTETNLPGLLPYVSPQYINAQARVSIEQEAAGAQNLPLAIPSPAPGVMTATLVDETNPQTIGLPFTLTSPDGVNWTSKGSQTINFTDSGSGNINVGLRVASGGGPSCGNLLTCYSTASGNPGIAYTRVWSNSGAPGAGSPPAPPQVQDATLVPNGSGGCPQTNGTFSNFISSSSSCSVQLNATVLFASPAVCNGGSPNVGLALTVAGQSPTMTCTGSTAQTTSPCSVGVPCVTTTWTSSAVNVGNDSPDGPVAFTLGWSQKFGSRPSGASGGSGNPKTCTQVACTGSFGMVQRAFNGAYDTNTANTSMSGPIIAANLIDSNNAQIMSVPRGQSVSGVSVKINTLNLNFQQQDPNASTPLQTGNATVLHTAGNQGTYAIECGGNNGSSWFTWNMATGCPQQFATTAALNPPICSTQPPGPPVCVNQNPGNGKTIAAGIDCRINGVIDYAVGAPGGCSPSSTCVSPNRWTANNTLKAVINQSPHDPRLIQLIIVDNSAWVGVTGASFQTPVRQFATFYVTGWTRSGQGADPCPTSGPGSSGQSANGLYYTAEQDPGSNAGDVLLGHFVKWTAPGGVGSGTCTATTFGNCVAVLTK